MLRAKVLWVSFLMSAVLGCGVLAAAQCENGFCRPPTYASPQRPSQPESPPSQAVCRIVIGSGSVRAIGTGMAISTNGQQTAILTAGHVVEREGLPAAATFPNGVTLQGQTIAVSRECDAAIIVVKGKSPDLAKIASDEPQGQQTLWFGGYDGGLGWRTIQGRLLGRTTQGDYRISGGARSGDSGGPVWHEGGLVGVVCLTNGQETICTSLPQLANFFSCGRYVFPWNAWLEDRKDAREHGQVLPPQGMPGAPRAKQPQSPQQPTQPLPTPQQPPQDQPPSYTQPAPVVPTYPAGLENRVAAMEAKLVALEAKLAKVDESVNILTAKNGNALEKAESAAGLAAEAKKHAEEVGATLLGQVKNYILGLLPIGWGVPIVIVLLVAAFLIWRDVRSRKTTGDPLEVEKLLQRLAAKTPTQVDDWFVDKLSKALDLILPRPTANAETNTKKGKAA